ncbi:hypothetical protein P8625_04310 [Tenacibaculum tangerinum]|uniref:OmpA-like domain-containing protein n=1 Tax=Tenacibaculum tangerinum TaxID=3038772 RepID=A0ABY8L4S5_9FLAO|nr:hypothetical protein [Tenacibaculum tangerinum]WGH76390.1 hypothetical protein P8625_04310 [Tenacibaculum tangerinum]
MKNLLFILILIQTSIGVANNECYKKISGEWVLVDCFIIQLENAKIDWNNNSASLTADQKKYIDSIILPTFSKNRKFKLAFTSYSKNTNPSQNLSQLREQSIINYLTSKGVNSERLISTGYGESNSKSETILSNLEETDGITLMDVYTSYSIATIERDDEDLRISKIESFKPEIKTLSVDEKKLERISLLSENRRKILSQCKPLSTAPSSHRKFNKIQLYAYEKIDGSVDLEFFKKLFSPKGKFDNLKISNLNGFYQPVECKCKIEGKDYTVGLAWFYGVISSLNINNKSGELKLSALDIVSASVTLGRSTVSGRIYGEGLYSDEMNIDFDLSTFSVKEYGNYNIFVKDYLDLRKGIVSKKTTFSPTLILLELYELNN